MDGVVTARKPNGPGFLSTAAASECNVNEVYKLPSGEEEGEANKAAVASNLKKSVN